MKLPRPKRRPARWSRFVTAIAATGLLALTVVVAPAAAADTTTPAVPASVASAPANGYSQEEVDAIGQSGVVFLDIVYTGYVQAHIDDTYPWYGPVKAEVSCSGYVVSNNGFIASAGHCGDLAEGRIALIDTEVSALVAAKTIDQPSNTLLSGIESAWKVEGENTGDPIVVQVTAYQSQSASGVSSAHPMAASVVEDLPLNKGDVLLLKVASQTSLPALQIAPQIPENGASITSVGYPGVADEILNSGIAANYTNGTVSNNAYTDAFGNPFIAITPAIVKGVSGGPVLDNTGAVVGSNSEYITDAGQTVNIMASADTIREVLARNAVSPTLSNADQMLRTGLSQYFAGQYREAETSFKTTLAAEPSNTVAQKYLALASTNEGKEAAPAPVVSSGAVTVPVSQPTSAPSSGGLSSLWFIIGGAVLLLIIIVLVILLMRRGRKSQPVTAEPWQAQPSYQTQQYPPVSTGQYPPVSGYPLGSQPYGSQPNQPPSYGSQPYGSQPNQPPNYGGQPNPPYPPRS